MNALAESRRERRLSNLTNANILNDRVYNLALGFVISYGLIINAILCFTLGNKMTNINPIVLIVGYFICSIIGITMSLISTNPFISFIGYNLVSIPTGLVLSVIVSEYINEGSGYLVKQAILYTAIVTTVMVLLSILFPMFFSKLGKILCTALLGIIVAEIIAIFIFGSNQGIFSWIGAIIFSLYIGYDFWKAQQYPKTLDNAIDCALDIYLDIVNLFIRILEIFSHTDSD